MDGQIRLIESPSEERFAQRGTAGFRSFWIAGLEASSHISSAVGSDDMAVGSRPDLRARGDYLMLKGLGFKVAQDTLCWHQIARSTEKLDFSSFLDQIHAAQASGVQVIWSLTRYGLLDESEILAARFVERFVNFATEAARLFKEESADIPYFAPINEISFCSWVTGGRGCVSFQNGQVKKIKRQLVRASVEACHALREIDPRCRFVHPEPIINVVAPLNRPSVANEAKAINDSQFEVWDMLAGYEAPELGGRADLLDIIGLKFDQTHQWEYGGRPLKWLKTSRDPRWVPLHRLTEHVWRRYQRPLIMAETSRIGVGVLAWRAEIEEETALALQIGVPIEGVCILPAMDRYDWNHPNHWHNSPW